MLGKLKDYQVVDVFCAGTFYKVKHKVTNNIFAWKAYDCSTYTDEQIQNVVNEVKTISKLSSSNVLRYYETILHEPTKTLYFVLEYNSWRSLRELIDECKATGKYISEGFIWRLLHELARVHRVIEDLKIIVLTKCITPDAIFVNTNGEIRVNCFDLTSASSEDVVRQIGEVIRILSYELGACDDNIKHFHYSDDLRDVVSFLVDGRNSNMRPEVVLYHPTVLANLEMHSSLQNLGDILMFKEYSQTSELNKCDSEKAVEMCKVVEPLPRTHLAVLESPIYMNISPKGKKNHGIVEANLSNGSLSPTLAALALELPGYVPRCRKPYTGVLGKYNCPEQVSEDTLSEQWMSRLIALRQREASLNRRERDLIAKEIVSSPSTKIVPLNYSQEIICDGDSNGITLPPMINQVRDERRGSMTRRRHRRGSAVRTKARRQSCGYEDLDSSLSADQGDSSIVITAAKITKENMPRRNIFPEVSSKKVHFTSSNPFIESDESVTLTFYELESGQQVSKQAKDVEKFKYLDLEKLSEKRSAISWSHSSPSKQAKTGNVFSDVTNHSSIRKTPSKTSLTSRGSNSSRFSMISARSQWSVESSGKVSEGSISERTRASIRQSLAQTPTAPDMAKSRSRKSLLHFKTPFKFISSTKI
ncbi:hypothetical protein K1T71_011977 [Dendrolimus kikuchii]|uniref:Uncharacterized protein n=1 Tax=Dendrolimus kikuchii TaxID=765133 RepID=A0ACC1CMM4_9NEOP|nr:hypothetical protein K1T71_011977 [Dendrolimus kikuchii]